MSFTECTQGFLLSYITETRFREGAGKPRAEPKQGDQTEPPGAGTRTRAAQRDPEARPPAPRGSVRPPGRWWGGGWGGLGVLGAQGAGHLPLQPCPAPAPGSLGRDPAVPSAVAAEGQGRADLHGAAGAPGTVGPASPSEGPPSSATSGSQIGQGAKTLACLTLFGGSRTKSAGTRLGKQGVQWRFRFPMDEKGNLRWWIIRGGDLGPCLSPQQLEAPHPPRWRRGPMDLGGQGSRCGFLWVGVGAGRFLFQPVPGEARREPARLVGLDCTADGGTVPSLDTFLAASTHFVRAPCRGSV